MDVARDANNPRPEIDEWTSRASSQLLLVGRAWDGYRFDGGRGAVLVKWSDGDAEEDFDYIDYFSQLDHQRRNYPELVAAGRGFNDFWAREVATYDPLRTCIVVVVSADSRGIPESSHYRISLAEGVTMYAIDELVATLRENMVPEARREFQQTVDALNERQEERSRSRWWRRGR